jgi:hypothetical protein
MSDVIVTSDYSNLGSGAITGRLGRTRKDGTRGRARMSIEIQSEPLVHCFDELQLGHEPAQAAAKALADRVRKINQPVAESTQLTRKYQEAAFQRGAPWARSRFGGPRMGPRSPDTGKREHFNHSGTFADSIVGTENRTEKSWTINVAANRLDPRTSRNAFEFRFITDALRRLVPEFDDPRRLAELPEVRAAVEKSIDSLIFKAAALGDKLRSQRMQTALRAFRLDGIAGGLQSALLGG